MATLTLPSVTEFSSYTFGLKTNTQVFKSPLNGVTQTLELPGALWIATYTLPIKSKDSFDKWRTFLIQLSGASGRFFAYDILRGTPKGVASTSSDTPVVNGANQTGTSLSTRGWRANGTGLLLPGDYISFQSGSPLTNELHIVTAQVDSDAFGNATISIAPQIRSSPADGGTITFINASCEMRLVDDNQVLWEIGPEELVQSFTFSAIEAF